MPLSVLHCCGSGGILGWLDDSLLETSTFQMCVNVIKPLTQLRPGADLGVPMMGGCLSIMRFRCSPQVLHSECQYFCWVALGASPCCWGTCVHWGLNQQPSGSGASALAVWASSAPPPPGHNLVIETLSRQLKKGISGCRLHLLQFSDVLEDAGVQILITGMFKTWSQVSWYYKQFDYTNIDDLNLITLLIKVHTGSKVVREQSPGNKTVKMTQTEKKIRKPQKALFILTFNMRSSKLFSLKRGQKCHF